MKILIICHYDIYDNTPRAFRTLELAKALCQKGYTLDLLVGSQKKLIENFIPRNNPNEKIQNAPEIKRFNKIRKIGSRILNYLYGDMVILKYYGANKKIVRNRKYDVIISVGQPFYPHMISAKMNAAACIHIADCGDPFYLKGKKMAPYLKWVQKSVFAKMDYVSVPTKGAIFYYTEYVDRKKLVGIPQGIDFSAYEISKYCKNPVPTFAYAGIFYENLRDPSNFIKYLSNIQREYRFILYTDTMNPFFKNVVKPLLEKCGKNVEIRALIPRIQCLKVLSKMDFLINFENKSSVQVPSKLIDYGIAKRPVLSFGQENFNPEIFEEFMRGDYSHQYDFDVSQFDINIVVKQFEMLFRRQ